MFLKLLSCVYLLHLFMSNVYPDNYSELLIKLSYNCVYAYTFIVIKAKKIYLQLLNDNPYVLEIMNTIYTTSKYDKDVEFILDNQIITTCTKQNIHLYTPNNFKFIIYSETVPQTSRINRVIIHNTQTIQEHSFKYELCNYMFISVDIHIQNDTKVVNYDLNFFFNGNNYYVANNKIDKYVVCFLLYSRYGIYQQPETCKYKLNIIDQSANIVKMCELDVIHLHKENYEIIEVICNDNLVDKESIATDSTCSSSEDENDEDYEKIKSK